MMPIYTFRCLLCGHERDEFRTIDERNRLPKCDQKCDGDEPGDAVSMERVVSAPMVAPDIGPYQAVAVDVATGKPPVINSRSAHRDFLKRNGYTEVGNERVGRQAGEVRGDFNLRKELTKATREVLGRGK